MQLTKENTQIIVSGLVDTVKVSDEIHQGVKEVIAEYPKERITIIFEDTFVITSSLVGSLLGVIKRDGVDLRVITKNKELYELLDKLNLIDTFSVSLQ